MQGLDRPRPWKLETAGLRWWMLNDANGDMIVQEKDSLLEIAQFLLSAANAVEPVDPEHKSFDDWRKTADEETDLPAPTQTVAEAATTLAKRENPLGGLFNLGGPYRR